MPAIVMAVKSKTERRPYLLRAMHEWMTDNGYTPHIVVNAGGDGVVVPREHVSDGKIILNVSYSATKDLLITNELVSFEARFACVPQLVKAPISAVLGIYARETSEGIGFGEESQSPGGDGSDEREPSRPNLRVVK